MADLFDRFESDYGQSGGGGQDWRQPRQQGHANPFEELEFTAAQSVSLGEEWNSRVSAAFVFRECYE